MDLLEYYHKTGKCPDRYYNQLNGKTAQENYNAMLERRREYLREQMEQERLERQVEQEVEKRLEKIVEDTLADLLSGFGK